MLHGGHGNKKKGRICTLLFRSEGLDVPQVLLLLRQHWSMAKTIASGGQAFAVEYSAETLEEVLAEFVVLAKAAEGVRGRAATRIHVRITPRNLLAEVLAVGEKASNDFNLVPTPEHADFVFTLHGGGKDAGYPFCYGFVPPSHDLRQLIPPFSEEAFGYPTNGVPRASRAFMKIKEVCECGQAPLRLDPSWVALDIGASPGGWTQVSHEGRVGVVGDR